MRPHAVVALLVALAVTGACRSARRLDRDSNEVTLCVENNAVMGTLRVWSDTFGRTHNVDSGERQCKRLGTGGGEVRLYAETIGGGTMGPARGYAILPNRPGECWLWDFRGVNDDGNIVPCEFRDGKGGG